MSRLRWFAVSLLLLLACLPLAGSLLPGSVSPGGSARPQEGQGGAYGTGAAPLKKGTIYGGSGPGGACTSTGGRVMTMVTMDFHWAAILLTKRYRADPIDTLCNDYWIWTSQMELPARQVLSTLRWPADLLQAQYLNQIVTVQPLQIVDPHSFQQKLAASTNACVLGVGPLSVNLCELLSGLVQVAADGIRASYRAHQQQLGFLWQTPMAPFTNDKVGGLLSIWTMCWSIVLTAVGVVLAWGSLRYLVGGILTWLSYANLLELLPRLILALLVAFYSKHFFLLALQVNNALTHLFGTHSLETVLGAKINPGDTAANVMIIIYGLLGYAFIVEAVARLAMIYVLFALAPLLAFQMSLRETAQIAKTGAVASAAFIFLQTVQAAFLDIGGSVLSHVVTGQTGSLSFLSLFTSITILLITLILFSFATRTAFGSAAGALAFGVDALSLGAAPLVARVGSRWAGGAATRAGRAWQTGAQAVTGGARGGAPASPGGGRGTAGAPASPGGGGPGGGSGRGGPGSGGRGGPSGGGRGGPGGAKTPLPAGSGGAGAVGGRGTGRGSPPARGGPGGGRGIPSPGSRGTTTRPGRMPGHAAPASPGRGTGRRMPVGTTWPGRTPAAPAWRPSSP